MPETWGPYTFVEHEVFDKKEDIDILFLGSSLIWAAIDAPQVQKELSKKLGRPAKVVSLGHSFNSIDIPYTQLRDLLSHKRRVRLVIFSIPRVSFTDGPSITAYKFLRYSEDQQLLDALPLKYKFSLYASSVLRVPHDLMTMARPNRSKPSQFITDLGALKSRDGWRQGPFTEYAPPARVFNPADLIESPGNQNQFEFIDKDVTPYQKIYLQKLLELLEREGIPLAMVNIPQYNERNSTKAIEIQDWSKSLGMDLPFIGIPPADLYNGLSEEDIKKLHFNEHLNKNGNEFFTQTIMPAILEVYDKHAAKN
jgi:hypothetical protein